ncbi:MAG: YhcH/YjgK/YiaL family protein [Saprospiraceae bacterium]|nr:YhcH/YjgK/YiaL family protein [Saprospiraceae bacterium]
MVHDKLENLCRYRELLPELFKYLQGCELNSLRPGKHEISDTLFVLVNEYETNTNDVSILENHKKYIDIQIILSGREKVAFSSSYVSLHQQYDFEADYELVKTKPIFMDFEAGFFFVFYSGEYHRPGIAYNVPEQVKKIVFKLESQNHVN